MDKELFEILTVENVGIDTKTKYLESLIRKIFRFVDKYRSLYQSVPTSDLEMDSLIGMINARIISMHESNNLGCSIGTEQVFNAIRKLKNDKRDGLRDFYSNHITKYSYFVNIID